MTTDPDLRRWLLQQRDKAFRDFYTTTPLDDYAKGQAWGILATFDNVLAQFGDRPIVNGAKDLLKENA
jgi:hypothetical protein